jgi:hypothetical protein
LKIACDAELAEVLGVTDFLLSKVRRKGAPVSERLVLRAHEVTGIPVSALREMLGVSEAMVKD